MKIQAITFATFLALLPLFQAKPMDVFKKNSLIDLLTAIMQEESMTQHSNEAVDRETVDIVQYPHPLAEMQGFSLAVTGCNKKVTEEMKVKLGLLLSSADITGKVTISCGRSPKTGDYNYTFLSCV